MIFPKNSDVMAQGRARGYENNYNHILLKWCQEFGTSLTVLADALKHVLNIGVDPNTAFESYNILRNYTGTLFAPQLGVNVFSDSTGSTPAVKDEVIGCIVDVVTVPITRTNPASSWSTPTGVTKDISAATITFSGSQAAYAVAGNLSPALVIGVAYRYEFTISNCTSGRPQVLIGGTNTTPTGVGVGANGTWAAHVTATTTSAFGLQDNGAAFNGTISNISVREVGLIATQATAGYKPILRVGAKNLLTYSEDFSNAAWPKSNVTINATKLDETTATGAHDVNKATQGVAGVVNTFSVELKAAERDFGVLRIDGSSAFFNLSTGEVGTIGSGVAATITPSSDGYYRCTVSKTPATTFYAVIRVAFSDGVDSYTGAAGSGIHARKAMLVTGTYTADNFPAYAPTTSAPASNGIGPAWMDFDGVDDRLQLSAVPFQMADDHFVVAGYKALKAQASVVVPAGVSTTSRYAAIGISGAGLEFIEWYDGTQYVPQRNTSSIGVTKITSALKRSGSLIGRSSGVVFDTDSSFTTAVQGTVAIIGNTLGAYAGPIYAIALGKGTVTDSELKTVERYIGQLSGVTTV